MQSLDESYNAFTIYTFVNKKEFTKRNPLSVETLKLNLHHSDFRIFKMILNSIMNEPSMFHVVKDCSQGREIKPALNVRMVKFFNRIFEKNIAKCINFEGDNKHYFKVDNFSLDLYKEKREELFGDNFYFDVLSNSVIKFT